MRGKVSARRMSRVNAVQFLYQYSITEEDLSEICKQTILPSSILNFEENKSSKVDINFFKEILSGAEAHLEEINNIIVDHLSQDWKIERLPLVMVGILRLSIYEILYQTVIPTAVIINEYIEVTRYFFDESEVAFVNGILDTVARKYR